MIANLIVLVTLSTSCQMGTHAAGNGHEDRVTAPTLGRPGMAEDVTRTIEITARDMKFVPASLEVQAGETVRFVVSNKGHSKHEFVIGADEGRHAEIGDIEGHEEAGEANEIELAVGETKELIWAFGAAQKSEFACHQPGHYEAGMLGTIAVKH